MSIADDEKKAALVLAEYWRGREMTFEGQMASFQAYMDAASATNPESALMQRYREFERDPGNKSLQEYFGHIRWAGLWGALGCPTLHVDAKWCALLCETTIPSELYDLVVPPWPAFVLCLPNEIGLVTRWNGEDHSLTRLAVGRFNSMKASGEEWEHWYVQMGAPWKDAAGNRRSRSLNLRLDDLCGDHVGEGCTDGFARSTDLIGPIIGGICMAFASGAYRRRFPREKRNRRQVGNRLCTEYVVGRDVRVDLRERVRSFIRSGQRHGQQKVQTLVRGHWKHQPYGPGSTERKFIHVEPYWRGPEDAPIAVRSHVLKKKSDDD